MTEGTRAPADFTAISTEFARLYESARRMVWVAPAQTLIDLRACGIVLVHRMLERCSYDRGDGFDVLLKLPEMRRLPVEKWAHLNWLRMKGNIAAHPEDSAPNLALDPLAQEGLGYAHGLAVWFCVERLGLAEATLPVFALPEKDTLDRLCGDAVLRGDPEALYLLGMHFKAKAEVERVRIRERLEHERVVINSAAPHDEQAAHWFTSAARHQHVAAAYELGLMKLHGRGCGRDIDEGYGLLEFAAEANLADAQHQLAVYHLAGHVEGLRDLPRDHEAARRLLERAAASEHPGALNCLMKIYWEGLGVPRDVSRALESARRSVDAGYPLAKLNLANFYIAEDISEQRPGEIIELLTAAAEAGIPQAWTALFKVRYHGVRGAPDRARAFVDLERAVKLGDPEAMIHMSAAYRTGEHGRRSLDHALELLLRVQSLPHLSEELRRRTAAERMRLIATLRADITPRMFTAVTTGLEPSLAERHIGEIALLYQALSPPLDPDHDHWVARGELAERSLAGIKLFGDVVHALRAAPDRLAPALRDELLRVLPDLDLKQFHRPTRPLPTPTVHHKLALTPVRAGPKVGRNEPCPCGSGRKSKRCCGALA